MLTSSAVAGRRTVGRYRKRRSKIKTALTVIISIVFVLAAAAGGFYFFENWKKDNTKICEECKQKFTGREKLCKNCLSVLESEYDDEEDVTHFCNQCGKEFESEALLCDECLGKTGESFYNGNYFCNICKTNLEKELIAITDTYGYVYCVQCDTGNYCQKCHSVLSEKDDDAICSDCAAIVCCECEEVLNKSEVGHEDAGVFYCSECYKKVKKKVCSECKKELQKDDDDSLCIDCAPYHCEKCKEVLEHSEIARESDDKSYCENCEKEEKFCNECGIILNSEDDDSVCVNCAEYSCEECGEVLTDTQVAATGDGGEYYCGNCFEKINDEILKNIDKTS